MAAMVCPRSRVSHPTLAISQPMRAWKFTDDESKNKTLMKRVVRISKQIEAQSAPVPAAFTFTVPPVISPAKARSDVSGPRSQS